MTRIELQSDSETATHQIGIEIGQRLVAGMTLALDGTLGAGKTRLVKGIAEGLGIDPENVNSPTFTLCVPHHGRLSLSHVDAYRIESATEVDQLGLDEWVEDGGVLIVEWAERVRESLPPISFSIHLEQIEFETNDNLRRLVIQGNNSTGNVLVDDLNQLKSSS